jgi:hypothetical protein
LDKSLRNVADKYLNGNQLFSLSVDIATTRGMKNAYLGIVASFFDQTDQFRRIALDLCKLSSKHEAAVIKLEVEQVLEQFNLDFSNVAVVVTDGAANMKAAFK